MATIEDFQRDLTNPSLVQGFVTQAKTVQLPLAGGKSLLVVSESPASLAAQAKATEDEYSLARLLKSEGYSGPLSQKARALVAIGQSVINKAKSVKKSVTELLTHSEIPAANGLYGEQSGRYAATSQDPRPYHLKLAKALLHGEIPDIVHGGMYFLDPWEPWAEQRGKKLEDFATVLKRWHDEYHYVRIPIPGLTEDALMVFKPEGDAMKRAASLVASIAAWKQAFIGRSSRDPEGRLSGDDVHPTIVSINKIKFDKGDYVDQQAAMRNYAADHYGRSTIDVNMSGAFLKQMVDYWEAQVKHVNDAGVGHGFLTTAIQDKWERETDEFKRMFPVYRKEAIRVGSGNDKAMVDPTIGSTFWRQLINFVIPINAVAGTPSVFTLILESVEEAIHDRLQDLKSAGSSSLKGLLIGGAAIVGGIILVKTLKD